MTRDMGWVCELTLERRPQAVLTSPRRPQPCVGLWPSTLKPNEGGAMDLPSAVLELARRQRGVVTRQQLRQLEVSAAQVRWRLSRSWRLVLHGVLLLDWA